MTTNHHTPLTGIDWANMSRLNSVFAELDSAISGGSITGTAGENLSELDFVYLASDGEWYQLDTDATVASSGIRGCVTESGGIDEDETGEIKLAGLISGFSGLTPWSLLYGSTTAGGYTQTRPNISAGGGQVAIAEMALAVSATEVMLRIQPVIYAKRASLADDATLTIQHHADAATRSRQVWAYVATTVAGASIASYSDSNQDADVQLRVPGLAGDTYTISHGAGAPGYRIGDNSDTDYMRAQQFQSGDGGQLTQFTFRLSANIGSPSGDLTWRIHEDNSDEPGTVLDSGTKTPTASAVNTVNVSGGPILAASTKYWLSLEASAQSTDDAYQWRGEVSSIDANVGSNFSTDAGSTWDTISVSDLDCAFTISATTARDKLAQSFEVTGSQTPETVDLWLKKVGSPTGTMTLRIETDNSGEPSGTLVHANATTTLAESGLGTSYADVTFTFASAFTISGSTTYWLVLSTDRSASGTNYVVWGADTSTPSYADGEMMSEASSSWSAESADAIFEVNGAGTEYDEPLGVGSVTGDSEEIGVRFDDGTGSDGDTKTTFKNLTGATADIVCEVVL